MGLAYIKPACYVGFDGPYCDFMTFAIAANLAPHHLPCERHIICLHGKVQVIVTIN